MKKKILAVFLSLCMAMSLLPMTVLAVDEGTMADASGAKTVQVASGSIDETITAANSGDTIQLTGDATFSSFTLSGEKTLTIDLNGHTLTSTSGQTSIISGGASLTIEDSQGSGELIYNGFEDVSKAAFEIQRESSITLDRVHYTTGGTGVYVWGNASQVTITNSEIDATGYCVGTNAGAVDNYKVTINITGSELTSALEGAGTAVLINVPGTLNIEGCTINGYWQGIIARGGTVTIRNSTITNTYDTTVNSYDTTWGSGNAVNLAGITIGNKGNNAYDYPVSVTLVDTNVTSVGPNPAVYIYQMVGENRHVTVNISGEGTVTGDFTVAKDSDVQNVAVSISGGTFSSNVSDYVPTGYEAVKDETDNTWTVGLKTSDGMEAGGEVTGTTSTGTVGGSFANDPSKNEGVTTSNANLTINVATGNPAEEGGEPTPNNTVTSTTVTIANQSLTSVNKEKTISNVTVFTDVGSLTLDKDAWNKITTDAGGNSVVLALSKEGDTAEPGTSQTYEITATVNGKEIYTEGNAGGSVVVEVPYTGNAPHVYYLGPDGAEEIEYSYKDGILSWTVEHFSLYAVCAKEQEASVTTAEGKTTCYDTLAEAINAAQDGDTVTLLKDVTVDKGEVVNNNGILKIIKDITLDGNSKKITVTGEGKNTPSVINIEESADVTIKNLKIDSADKAKHGLNLYKAGEVTVENVTIKDGTGYGIVCNSSDLTVNGLTTSGNDWGGINIDTSAGEGSNFAMTSGNIQEGNSVCIENGQKKNITAQISGGSFKDVMLQNVDSNVDLDITGGSFNDVKEVTKTGDTPTENPTPSDMITITGGTFKENVSDYLADGLVQNADGSVGKPYIPPANPNYRIDIPAAEGGTVTADPAAAKAGATVTLTATPDEGYAVGTITVTDRFGDAVKVTENADGTYTFTMPNGQVTVKATFVETEEPAPAEPFPDVDENDWFYDEVVYVYENGLMNGVENNQFAPNTATNRAMLATILYRLAGEPAVSGDLPFTDVESGTWYTDAVLWAAQNGIVNGLGENTFAPMNTLTREQLVTMLYRYAEAEGYDVSAAADLSGYPDADKVQTYAQEAMSWAVAEGIVEGMDGNLNPAGSATRAQIATILMRFCEGVAK